MGYFIKKNKGLTQGKVVKKSDEQVVTVDTDKQSAIIEEKVVVPEKIHLKRGINSTPEPTIMKKGCSVVPDSTLKKGNVVETVIKKVFEKKGQQSGRNLTELYKLISDKKNLNSESIDKLSKTIDRELKIKNVNRSFIDLTNLKNFISGKNIILVANSSDLLKNKNGRLIDSYDIVIRFNSFKLDEEYTGKKTTIHTSVYLQDINLDQFVPIRFVVSISLKNWIKKIESLDKFKQSLILKYNHHNEINGQKITNKPPTTGFVMLTLLLKLGGYEKIDLIGFNFYENGLESILRTDEGVSLNISSVHDYNFEKNSIMENANSYDKENNIITFYDNSSI
jgi:hypothetical protein